MSNVDYEELIRSPLEGLERERNSSWGWSALGLLVGGLVGLAMAAIFGAGSDGAVTTTIPSTTVASANVEVVFPIYPDGYTEIAPGLGARVSEVDVQGETVTMFVETVVERGGDALAPIWPVGGMWWLESESGATVESSRVVLGRFTPGVFSVEFPVAAFGPDRIFARARLAERWDQLALSGSTTLPYTGEPYEAPEPISLVVSQDVTLIVEVLELGRFLGKVGWTLQGAELGGRVEAAAVLLDADGAEIGRYQAFPDLLPPSSEGTNEIFWNQHFSIDQTGAETVVLEYSVYVAELTPTDITLDLSGGQVGR